MAMEKLGRLLTWTRPVDTPMCLGYVKTVRYTSLIRRATPRDTRLCNMTVCRTQLRHTSVSLPM
ncbi:hypothetical protein F383_36892 [Gossypium arboreum]|uniref:Uncharacterized protein n=1 Tax=Gossypium arboreum TaxID=29729 RepID=A0A0B0MEE7_GOSAR|nr:hypothetical protein F383_36892 [Gossypium arboreum]